jgi:hypothetical protein
MAEDVEVVNDWIERAHQVWPGLLIMWIGIAGVLYVLWRSGQRKGS